MRMFEKEEVEKIAEIRGPLSSVMQILSEQICELLRVSTEILGT